MIGCISPNIGNCEQSLNTLRYADRVKERNAATGAYSGPVDQVSASRIVSKRLLVATLPSNSRSQSPVGDDDGDGGSVTAVLDDLLSPSPVKQPLSGDIFEPDDLDDGTDAREVAKDLIQCHKEAMSEMLDMLKVEMDLVNRADGDRDSFDEYVLRLNALQDQQLSFIVSMREQLLRYHSARNSKFVGRLASPSEDSFEDLRD
jgi:hypothetical protein